MWNGLCDAEAIPHPRPLSLPKLEERGEFLFVLSGDAFFDGLDDRFDKRAKIFFAPRSSTFGRERGWG